MDASKGVYPENVHSEGAFAVPYLTEDNVWYLVEMKKKFQALPTKQDMAGEVVGGGLRRFIFIRFSLLIPFTYTDQMVHDTESINKGSGENLAYFQPGDPNNMPIQCQGPKTPSCVQCREMVADWYSEESNYDYNTGESKGGEILHFTQVVWKETTELGMATATSADTWFSVARYKKRGNMGYAEDYIENVPRPQ